MPGSYAYAVTSVRLPVGNVGGHECPRSHRAPRRPSTPPRASSTPASARSPAPADRRQPGARLRPGPRRRRRRDGRRLLDYGAQGRRRGPHRLRLRRRRRRRPGRQAVRPRGRVGRRRRARSTRAAAVRRAPTATRRSSPRSPTTDGPRHLDDDFEMVQDTFRRFADDKIAPVAEHIHRDNARHPRGHHRGPGRDGRLRPVGARGVRRLRGRRRVRLPRHGRRHRGAVARLARRRRLADHPARDPHPGPA